ncbi:hypothetical protein [Fervidibacillus albus]|uniref:Uncharacterized protein n=1 Tax=Fervidibacillus albus TaxID=2980026 RepID=A0A9E8LSA6_9BACI|nr:hypothetical protein [Fervidibacillus albus]WAA08674.1 hypothetical protein OE104_08445 [Fervidibacillus albus]
MGNRSRRFVKQGMDAVKRHAEKIPYHMTYAEALKEKEAHHSTEGQTE